MPQATLTTSPDEQSTPSHGSGELPYHFPASTNVLVPEMPAGDPEGPSLAPLRLLKPPLSVLTE